MPGPDWEERISRDTNPAIRIEHEARYRVAMPVVREAPVWCDLGCGNGIAAAAALGGPFARRAVLVDVADDALRHAEREIEAQRTVTLAADLNDEADLRRVRETLLAEDAAGGCITCFEVVEHLNNFVPMVEMFVDLVERPGFTVVLSVPNDAFWSIKNPFHHTMWGEGAFEELRRLLPEDHVVLRQFALHGSVVLADGEVLSSQEVDLELPTDGTPTHLLVGIGPAASRMAGAGAISQADLVEERRWQRQRESDLAFLQALEGELSEFRKYIHELEGRLGLPLSGTGGEDSA
jgi:SAM-dependent methyltransferase